MDVTRREFLVISGVVGAGVALSSLGLDLGPTKAYADELKIDRMKSAKHTTSICPYCAVGCGLIVSTDTKAGKIINIEGDPDHPINEGTLCAKARVTLSDHSGQSQPPDKGALSSPQQRQVARQELGLGHHRDREKNQENP